MSRAVYGAGLALALAFGLAAGGASATIDRFVVEERGELPRARIHKRLIEEGELTRKYDLRVVDESGLELEMFVREPKRPRDDMAGMLLLAGFGTGREALDLVEERDDVVVMSMNYPYEGERRIEPTGLQKLRRTAFAALDGGVLAVDYLSARDDVDDDRIVLVGVSFGALFATPVAAYDKRVDGLVLIYGGGDLPEIVASNPPAGLSWVPPSLIAAGTWAYAGDFDPLHHIEALAPRPLLMANSTSDETFPVSSARKLFARAKEPKEILWYDTGHADLFEPRVVAGIADDVVEVLEGWGLVPEGSD